MLRTKKHLLMVMVFSFLLISISLTPDLSLGQAKTAEKVIKWRMATPWAAGSGFFTDMAKILPDVVKEMSGGRLIIDSFPGGAIVPALEVVDATRRGVCQIGHTWPGYDIGISPATCLIGGYVSSPDSEAMLHWIYGDGYKLWQDFRREKFNVIAFPGGMYPPEVFLHSHKPVRTLADLKGLKVRTVGAWADILPKLGAAVITLPGAEVLPALERKVIDATEYATAGLNRQLGFHEIAKYVIIPGVHQPNGTFEYVINTKAWDELPDDLKAIVEKAAKIAMFESWIRMAYLDMGAIEAFKKHGNIIIELSPEVRVAAVKLGNEWADEKAAKEPWFKKILESQRKFVEKWGAYEPSRTLKTK